MILPNIKPLRCFSQRTGLFRCLLKGRFMKPAAFFVMIFLFSFVLIPVVAIADMYQWTDEHGITHYSNKKPPAEYKDLAIKTKETTSSNEYKTVYKTNPTEQIVINNNVTQSNTNSNVVDNNHYEIVRVRNRIKHIEDEIEDARRRHYSKTSPSLREKTQYREIIGDYNEELDELKSLLIDLQNR
jgi:hypothetical protein